MTAKFIQIGEPAQPLAARWMMRAGMGQAFGAKVADTTVGGAIEQQRTFEAEQAAKKAEEKALAEKVAKGPRRVPRRCGNAGGGSRTLPWRGWAQPPRGTLLETSHTRL